MRLANSRAQYKAVVFRVKNLDYSIYIHIFVSTSLNTEPSFSFKPETEKLFQKTDLKHLCNGGKNGTEQV